MGLFLRALSGVMLLSVLVLWGERAYFSNERANSPSTQVVPITFLEGTRNSLRDRVTRITLPKSRTVYLIGEVNESQLKVAKQIAILGRSSKPIYLVINSPGGSVFHGAAIIEAMQAARGPVHTVCVQMCASMAAFIFEYGDTRMMFGKSLLMFHPASSGAEQGELDKMVSQLVSVQEFIKRFESYVAQRVGLSFEQYKLLAYQEIWLDSVAATSRKFADQVVFVDLPDELLYPGLI